jgi:hypothetical protein
MEWANGMNATGPGSEAAASGPYGNMATAPTGGWEQLPVARTAMLRVVRPSPFPGRGAPSSARLVQEA